MDVQQREYWTGSAFLGNAWTMAKGTRTATCELWSHQFGWELRLMIGELLRSQVCRTTDDVLRVHEEWQRAIATCSLRRPGKARPYNGYAEPASAA